MVVAVFIGFASVRCSKKSDNVYDCCAGKQYSVDWTNVLPLWHCSIFLYAAPFAIFSKGRIREAAGGYICTLGLLGGAVNFLYPASYLSSYSCISLAGFRTIFYHGAMIFTAVTMLLSGYIVNFTVRGADYMFFKMESFFFAPIGKATSDWLTVILMYVILLFIYAIPYVENRKKTVKSA